MPRRALGAPRGVGVLDQPSARYSHCHQCGEAEAGDERRAHELMVECPGVMSEEVPDGAEGRCPDCRAGEVVSGKTTRVHSGDAGDERDEHTYNRHESAE